DDVDLRGDHRRVVGHGDAWTDLPPSFIRDVITKDVMARRGDASRHGRAHPAQSDEADPHPVHVTSLRWRIRRSVHQPAPLVPETPDAIVVTAQALVGWFAARQETVPDADTLHAALLSLPGFPVLRQVAGVLRPIEHPVLVAEVLYVRRVV